MEQSRPSEVVEYEEILAKHHFKSTAPQCKQIAQSNGATYEIITNGQIPGTIKTWLDSKEITYIELFY